MIGCRYPMGNFLQLFIDKRKRCLLSRLRTDTWQPEPCAGMERTWLVPTTRVDVLQNFCMNCRGLLSGGRSRPCLNRMVSAQDRDQLASRRQ